MGIYEGGNQKWEHVWPLRGRYNWFVAKSWWWHLRDICLLSTALDEIIAHYKTVARKPSFSHVMTSRLLGCHVENINLISIASLPTIVASSLHPHFFKFQFHHFSKSCVPDVSMSDKLTNYKITQILIQYLLSANNSNSTNEALRHFGERQLTFFVNVIWRSWREVGSAFHPYFLNSSFRTSGCTKVVYRTILLQMRSYRKLSCMSTCVILA